MSNPIKELSSEKRWYNKAKIISEYHEAQLLLHNNVRGNKWKVSDTAETLELSVGYVSESLMLIREIKKCPVLEKLTRENALNVLRNNK